MRRIEARFHDNGDDEGDYVVVGYVVWDSGKADAAPHVEAASVIGDQHRAHPMLLTLRHLVRVTGPQTVERLTSLSLSSTRWSFVDVSGSKEPRREQVSVTGSP
jgi:hypothetical protein